MRGAEAAPAAMRATEARVAQRAIVAADGLAAAPAAMRATEARVAQRAIVAADGLAASHLRPDPPRGTAVDHSKT